MPELVRHPIEAEAGGQRIVELTPLERRLYLALAIVLSLNMTVLCGALTFFGLLYGT